MTKKSFFIGMLCILITFGLTASGCSTTRARISRVNEGSFTTVNVAAKDFTTVGLVFVENRTQHSRSGSTASASGEVFTYYALLQEAKKLGGEAIINVTIDSKIVSNGQSTKLGALTFSDTEDLTEIWYGSALAIKYTNKLVEGDVVSIGNGNNGVTGSGGGSSAAPQKKKLFGIIPLPF